MIISRISQYLEDNHIKYQPIEHMHSSSSIGTAISSLVPLEHIAKAVILIDHEGKKVMAILPANHKVRLSLLNDKLLAHFRLAKEQEIFSMFEGCEHGAIPPLAEAFNCTYVVDSSLDRLSHIYVEAGDHQTLLKIERHDFESLVANGKHFHFSTEAYH